MGFIPDDGVICDLGECLTKLDSLLFQIFTAMSLYARESQIVDQTESDGSKCVTGRLLGQKICTSIKILALKVNE